MNEIRGLGSLRRHDPKLTNLSIAMLRLLRAHAARDCKIEVSKCDTLAAGIPLFACADGTQFCIANAYGIGHPACESDIDAACNALDSADTLLRHIETALAISLDPVDLTNGSDVGESDAYGAVLTVSDGDYTVYLAVRHTHPKAEHWIDSASKIAANLNNMPLVVQLLLSGPKLPIAAASDIGNGDMLMIGHQMLTQLHIVNAAPINGIFDLNNGSFVANDTMQNLDIEGNMGVDESENTDNGTDAAARFGALKVPVMIRLPEQVVSAADIANLQSGATLILGPVVQGLIADLVVGGKALARGEIVQVGTNFALLIDDRSELASRTASRTETAKATDTIGDADAQIDTEE